MQPAITIAEAAPSTFARWLEDDAVELAGFDIGNAVTAQGERALHGLQDNTDAESRNPLAVLLRYDPGNSTTLALLRVDGGRAKVRLTNIAADLAKRFSELDLTLRAVYERERLSQGRQASQLLLGYIEDHLARQDLHAVDELVTRIEVRRLSIWSLIGLVRSTARANRYLPGWSRTYTMCREAVFAAGHDPDKVYVGIRDAAN